MEASARKATWQRKYNQQAPYHPSTSSTVSDVSSKLCRTVTSPCNSTPKGAHDVPKDILPHQRKWWLHVQPPDLGQTLHDLEFAALSSATGLNKDNKLSEEFDARDFESVFQPSLKISPNIMKSNLDELELNAALNSSDPQHLLKKNQALNVSSYSNHNHIFVREKTQKEVYLETESPWSEAEKNERWWRHANKDELASFVAQKSVEHIENCDLPRPQKKPTNLVPSSTVSTTGVDICNPCTLKNPTSLCELMSLITNGSCTIHGFVGPFSETDDKTIEDEGQSQTASEPTKSELLEALCHSQTRAREAEEAAQQAYTEKEHILSLFFRQTSHLFAYSLWFQMLQLESFYLQLKRGDPPSGLFPYRGRSSPALNKSRKNNLGGSPRIWWVFGKSVMSSAVGLRRVSSRLDFGVVAPLIVKN